MGKIIILGTAAAIPSEGADNTHLVILSQKRIILVDTATNPILSLSKAGLDPNSITDLILTHFHPDHVSGLPILMITMWLTGRKETLDIYGLDNTLGRVRQMLELFNISQWVNMFPINYHSSEQGGINTLFSDDVMTAIGAEVKHLIPTMGLRFEFNSSGKVIAYTCDSEPCDAIQRLAKGADILLHESAGNSKGHSSALHAGEDAALAGVNSLWLIHYPSGMDEWRMIEEAKTAFSGEVIFARDFMSIEID
jgi:ribonuclease Z